MVEVLPYRPMNASPTLHATADDGRPLDDLPIGSMKMVHVDDHRLCLIRTSAGVFALDHACPHEGYGMTRGSLDGNLHHLRLAQLEVPCRRRRVRRRRGRHHDAPGDRRRRRHGAGHPAPARPRGQRPRLLASLRRGIKRDYIGQVGRDVVRLLQADTNPGELVWEAVQHGAPRADLGLGQFDRLGHRLPGHGRALRGRPAGAADRAGDRRDRRDRTRSADQPVAGCRTLLPARPARGPFRERSRARAVRRSPKRWCVAPSTPGAPPAEVQRWFTAVASDHLLSYGHGAIYCQKAFELLDMIGWDRADTVLPHLVPTIVYGTRRKTSSPTPAPSCVPSTGADLVTLSELPVDDRLARRRHVAGHVAGPARKRSSPLWYRRCTAAPVSTGCSTWWSPTVAERMMRYDPTGERDLLDDFGWLDITHGMTYANAARWHHRLSPGADTVRLAMFTAFLAQWTGRHEWHTQRCRADEGRTFVGWVVKAGEALQREALLDNASAFIGTPTASRPAGRRHAKQRALAWRCRCRPWPACSTRPVSSISSPQASPVRSNSWPGRHPATTEPIRRER